MIYIGQTIYICVRKPDAVRDSDGERVEVLVHDYAVVPSASPNRSGIEYLFSDKGVFQRYDCYSPISPYGWERCTALCNRPFATVWFANPGFFNELWSGRYDSLEVR